MNYLDNSYILDFQILNDNKFILLNVWNFLNYRDICRLIKCSKEMKFICREMNKVNNISVFFTIKTNNFCLQRLYLLDMHSNFFNITELTIYFPYNYHQLNDILIQNYLYNYKPLMKSLKSLTIEILSPINLFNISNLKNLEFLSLKYSNILESSDFIYLEKLDKLKTLDITSCVNLSNDLKLSISLQKLKSLHTINFSCIYINGSIFYNLKECKNINTLKFCFSRSIKTEFYNIQHFSHLIHINLSDTSIDGNDLIQLCDCLKLLEEFFLDNVSTIKNNRSLYHIHKLTNLRILSLEGMECNTRFMSLICQTLINLEVINLNDNNFMRGYDLLFLNMLCKLKSVSFDFIQNLSVHHLTSLRKKNVKLLPLKIEYDRDDMEKTDYYFSKLHCFIELDDIILENDKFFSYH